jgi:hypothetical protein
MTVLYCLTFMVTDLDMSECGSEFNAAAGNPNLRRAIIRALQRPMSVLRTNIATILLPLISSPAFLTPAVPSVQAPNPNPTQLHALAYATFAGELVETFSDMGLGTEYDTRDNSLRTVRDDLASMVSRVVGPLFGAIKTELCPIIEALEHSPVYIPSPGKVAKVAIHPSIATLQTIIPVFAKTLARYATSTTAQTQLASLLISVAWRGLVALSARESLMATPPPTPKMLASGLDKKKPRQLSSTSPPTTPPSARFMLKLPPSRPPSPPGAMGLAGRSTVAGDAKALFDLLNTLPRPAADKEATKLAHEAVDEVFDALQSLVTVIDAVQQASRLGKDADALAICQRVDEDLPTLIALPVLLRAFVFGEPTSPFTETGTSFKTVAELLSIQEEAYASGFLHGFGRAEEYAPAVGTRVLDILNGPSWQETMKLPNAQAVVDWLTDRVEGDESEDADTSKH